MQEILDRIERAYAFIESRTLGIRPTTGIILGSGFSEWTAGLRQLHQFPYSDIPGFPTTTVIGHSGNLIFAEIGDSITAIMQGRFHFYEGHPMPVLSIPVRLFKKMGIKTLLLTNASGSINQEYQPGDLMVLKDHINLVQTNPLIGPNAEEFGTRFPDASTIYDPVLSNITLELAARHGFRSHNGVYIFTSGPIFETPAEIRMMRLLGADAVGMSTVPEAISACHAGLKVVGLSLLANLGSGLAKHPLTHEDVMKTMNRVAPKLHNLLTELVPNLSAAS